MTNKKTSKKNISVKEELAIAEDKLEQIAKNMAINSNPYNKKNIIIKGTDQFKKYEQGEATLNQKDDGFKMLTLFEFDSHWLLMLGFSEAYKAIAVNMSQQIQQEYDCQSIGEKATAHLAAQSYVKTLELQRYINLQLDRDSYTDMSTRRLAVLEKSLDRANKQYINAIHTLRALKQPPIQMIVKANTANVANQQLIKQDTYEKKA